MSKRAFRSVPDVPPETPTRRQFLQKLGLAVATPGVLSALTRCSNQLAGEPMVMPASADEAPEPATDPGQSGAKGPPNKTGASTGHHPERPQPGGAKPGKAPDAGGPPAPKPPPPTAGVPPQPDPEPEPPRVRTAGVPRQPPSEPKGEKQRGNGRMKIEE